MRTGAHALFLLSRDGERLGRISTDHYKTWTLNARLPRTEDYVLVYAYTHEYENYGVRMAVRASDPELR